MRFFSVERKNIIKKVSLSFGFLFLAGVFVYAAGGPFTPGFTLDPTCDPYLSPGVPDTDCVVTAGSGGGMVIGDPVASATAGSLFFADSNGYLAQDNGGLFWDELGRKLGIGTNSPIARMHADGESISTPANIGGVSKIIDNSGYDEFGIFGTYTGTTASTWTIRVTDDSSDPQFFEYEVDGVVQATNIPMAGWSQYMQDGIHFYFTTTAGYANGDEWQFDVTPSSTSTTDALVASMDGGELLRVGVDGIRFYDTYTFPAADGNSGEVLVTDGSGSLSWGSVSGSGMAIGGSVSGVTGGSVLFGNSKGNLGQDNKSFFWDEQNRLLGLGTNSPHARLNIDGIKATSSLIYPATKTVDNSGLDNLSVSGTYAGTTDSTWTLIIVDDSSSPQQFEYYIDGSLQATNIDIAKNGQTLQDGVFVDFGSQTGYANGDEWQFDVEAGSADIDALLVTMSGDQLISAGKGGINFFGTYNFPSTDGTSGQVLKTNGAGVLSWEDDDTGGGGGGSLAIGDLIGDSTSGSVLFVDSDTGLLNENNSNYYWDNGRNRLYLGSRSGGAALNITSTLVDPGSTTWVPEKSSKNVSGLDDATYDYSGYNCSGSEHYIVEISNAGSQDEFMWTDDKGGTWYGPVTMSGSNGVYSLSCGITISFASDTGHNPGDYWKIFGFVSNGTPAVYNDPLFINTSDGTNIFSIEDNGNFIINNVSYVFPSSQGGAGEVLTNDGSGNLTWSTSSGGGSSLIGSTSTSGTETWLGSGAGSGNASSDGTFFAGLNTGYAALNAVHAIFVGYEAGYNATNASSSNFIGASAGWGATNASNSNFIGASTGYNATGASHVNFFGYTAGSGAASATYSNFFGTSAGAGAENADNSNFMGKEAGASATNARRSNFFGYWAGNGATDAASSNFFGYQSGVGAADANNSIFIGENSGYNDTVDNSSGGTSILIGDSTSTGGNSNSIALGAGATNTAANQFLIDDSYTQFNMRGVNYFMPSSGASSSGQVLTSDTSGNLSWTTPSSSGTIGLSTGTSGTDVNVSGSPASLGGTLTLNIPDASVTARGLVTTGTQTIAGTKTFSSAPLITGFNQGGVVYSGLSGLLASTAAGTSGQVLISNGTSAPTWQALSAWSTTGNSGTTAGTNFIGTTDAKDLVFKTNNTETVRFKSDGNIQFGSSSSATGVLFGPSFAALNGTASAGNAVAFSAGVASGPNSVAFSGGTASGWNSFALGGGVTSSGRESFAIGHRTQSIGEGETAIGWSNTLYTPTNVPQTTDRIFVVGNGDYGPSTRSDAFTILHNGQVGVGIDNFETNSNGNIFQVGNGSTGVIGYINSGTGAWVTVSDARDKDNIEDLNYNIDTLMSLRPVSFDYKNNGEHTIGFIAQEAKDIVPESVFGSEDTKYGMSYSNLVPVTVKAVQDIFNLVDSFKEKLVSWFADAANNIELFIAGTIKARNELCVGETCINEGQLQQLLQNQTISSPGGSSSGGGGTVTPDPDPIPDPTLIPDPLVDEKPIDIINGEQQSTSEITPTPDPVPETVSE